MKNGASGGVVGWGVERQALEKGCYREHSVEAPKILVLKEYHISFFHFFFFGDKR